MSARTSFEEATERLGRPAELEDAGEVIDDLRQRAEAAEAERDKARDGWSAARNAAHEAMARAEAADQQGEREDEDRLSVSRINPSDM